MPKAVYQYSNIRYSGSHDTTIHSGILSSDLTHHRSGALQLDDYTDAVSVTIKLSG